MSQKNNIIRDLFNNFEDIRYVAIYMDHELLSVQREASLDNSSETTDHYEELLVNPALITLARQRGNIDCGGLRFLIVGYGNFYQLIKEIKGGHISICLDKQSNLTTLPETIFSFLESKYSTLFLDL